MLNVEKARLDRVYGNDKLTPMITAFGAGFGDDFDLAKLRYGKIILMADADVDGSHIRTLLLTFFFRFMRPLIEHGHVFIAQPPLFKNEKGKDVRYTYTEEQQRDCIAEMGDNVRVQRYKGSVRWTRSNCGKPPWTRSIARCCRLRWRTRPLPMRPLRS